MKKKKNCELQKQKKFCQKFCLKLFLELEGNIVIKCSIGYDIIMLHRYPILKKDINMDFTVTRDITAKILLLG